MNEELLEKPSKIRRWLYVNRVWFITFFAISAFGLYAGYLLFGSNSLEVLLRLNAQKSYLQEQTQKIEAQNAHLQKQIFELKDFRKQGEELEE